MNEVKEMRKLFWERYSGEITQFELEAGVKIILDNQLTLIDL